MNVETYTTNINKTSAPRATSGIVQPVPPCLFFMLLNIYTHTACLLSNTQKRTPPCDGVLIERVNMCVYDYRPIYLLLLHLPSHTLIPNPPSHTILFRSPIHFAPNILTYFYVAQNGHIIIVAPFGVTAV